MSPKLCWFLQVSQVPNDLDLLGVNHYFVLRKKVGVNLFKFLLKQSIFNKWQEQGMFTKTKS